ncbi:nitrous oxide reductase accessory protein NosL [Halorientalis salina]|uniref:nitrous oxide reductase accessory protein NosL n=1 Tax=Halorientalis salina TaxID=2932266 RepID=UPI0010AD3420|nr:nitrous oxide reductase accessory protein NosL [Halorientalis salina]
MSDRKPVADGIVTRRRLLRASAAATVLGVAGCSQQGETTSTPSTDTTEPATDTADQTTQEPAADLSEPVEPVPEESRCAVCNMYAADYAEWNAQATHENGDRKYFCSPGCLTAYHATPGHFDDAHEGAKPAYAWARDYDSREYVDATSAAFVLEETAAHIDAPMGENPVPFESEQAAQGYVDQYESLTREDVVGLSAFDVALARRFRADSLPETDQKDVLQPVSVPSDAECTVCNMLPANSPAWNAQASHEDGERAHFCSPGCLVAYYADPGHFIDGREQSDIVGVWTHGPEREELLDATMASFVLDTNAERTGGPMMGNPLAYADETDAASYVDEYDDLGSEDVVRLQEITREDAASYRGSFL